MKNRIVSVLKKRWLLIWCVAVIVAYLNMIVAFADYPSGLANIKRVVKSASEEKGTLFSSNILIENGISSYAAQYKTVLSAAEIEQDKTYDVDVYFWNYSLKDIYSKYGEPIDYTLSFELTNIKGEPLNPEDLVDAETGAKSITIIDQDNHSLTLDQNRLDSSGLTGDAAAILSQTLAYDPNSTSQNSLKLKFSNNWDLDNDENICVKIIADVDGIVYTDLYDLGAIIGLKKVNNSDRSGWYAYLNEHRDSSDNRPFADFDGFNLIIEGSGQATITVKIDTTKYGINKNFYGSVSVPDAEMDADGNVVRDDVTDEIVYKTENKVVRITEASYDPTTGELTINANSNAPANEYRNRYNIQLYKKGESNPANFSFFDVKRGTSEEVAAWLSTSSADVKVGIANSTN